MDRIFSINTYKLTIMCLTITLAGNLINLCKAKEPKVKWPPHIQTVLDLDVDLHNPTRLSILMFLLPRGRAPFTIVQKALGLTSGNLSSHIKKLQNKGYIEVRKKFINS